MSTIATLIDELGALAPGTLLVPLAVFIGYWVISRILRARLGAPWLYSLVLLLDVLVYPAVLIFLQVEVTGLEAQEEYLTLRRVIWSLLALVMVWLLVRLLRRFVWRRAFVRRYGREAPRILQHLVALVLLFIAIFVILVGVFDRSAGGFLVSTGVIVGVVGLALQNVLSDLFSGITIALEQPYGVGDWIQVSPDAEGEVTDITWQSTYLRSFQNALLAVPNSRALRSVVHNYSRPDRRHASWVHVHVDRHYDVATVRRLILEAALTCNAVEEDPTPVVNVDDASGNPLRYVVYVYFRDYRAHFSGVNDLYMNIHAYLSRSGIVTSPTSYELATESAPERRLQMPSLREEIGSAEIFSMLSEEQVDVIAEHAAYHTYYPEDVIVRQGTRDTTLLIIASGVVQVTKQDAAGREVEVARLGSGDIIGEMSLLTGEPRSATVKAVVQVSVIEVTKEALEPVLQAEPALSDAFAQVMLERRLKTEQFLESMRQSDKAASDFVSDYVEAVVRRMRRFFRV
jgi:branched-chain amino acid transport system substrate-binding protein